jgi:glycosyltransferase involved in cell wall biosynthesis
MENMNKKKAESFIGSKKLKILTTPLKDDGCSWYRLKVWREMCQKNGLAMVEPMSPDLSDKMIEDVFNACDVLLVRFHSEAIVDLIKPFKQKHPKKPIIFDTDDDAFNVSPINEAYANFGTQEVNTSEGKPLWVHGQAGFDMYRNRHRLVDYEYCLEQSDLITTTTLKLAESLKPYNEAVAVIPNSIIFSRFPVLDIRKDKTINLLWAGGASHYEDLFEIKQPLIKLMNTYPQLHFHIAGQGFDGITKDLPKDRFHYWPWSSAQDHGYRLACINADIALAPLRDIEFNYYKSNIKYYEYSALKIPTIAKDMMPYNTEIQDGLTGLLYKTEDEFIKAVEELITDPIKRIQIGQEAYRWVNENRNAEEQVKDWLELIKETIKAKNG